MPEPAPRLGGPTISGGELNVLAGAVARLSWRNQDQWDVYLHTLLLSMDQSPAPSTVSGRLTLSVNGRQYVPDPRITTTTVAVGPELSVRPFAGSTFHDSLGAIEGTNPATPLPLMGIRWGRGDTLEAAFINDTGNIINSLDVIITGEYAKPPEWGKRE